MSLIIVQESSGAQTQEAGEWTWGQKMLDSRTKKTKSKEVGEGPWQLPL